MTDSRRIFPAVEKILILVVLAAIVLSLGNMHQQRTPTVDGMEQLRGWYYIQNGTAVSVEPPCTIRLDGGGNLVLYNDSLTAADASKTLTTRGGIYRLQILLGDQVLYAYDDSEFPRNEQMRSKLDCTASLRGSPEGKTLTLVYENQGDGCFEIPAVYVGSSSAVFRWQAANDGFTLAMVFTMLLIGILAVGVHIYLSIIHMPDPRFANVACSLFICAAWCALDSSLVQQLSNMSPAVCYLSFYAFMTLAVPMLHFVRNTEQMNRFRSLDVCLLLFYGNVVLQSLLDFCGVFHFIDMLLVTHLLLAGGTALVTILMLQEYKRTHAQEILAVLVAVSFMAAGGLLAIVLYWLLRIPYYGAVFEIGILIYIICLLCSLVNTTVENLRFKTEAIVYQRLSQEDCLTGLSNRRGFEEYMNRVEEESDNSTDIALVFMDLNGLKNTNDRYGHNAGDELIIAAAQCISSAFAGMGTCFRIGGDEFAVILPDPTGSPGQWQGKLEEAILQYNQNARYRLSIACGISMLRDESGRRKRLSDWKYEADQEMYASKRRQMNQPSDQNGFAAWREEGTDDGV